MIDFEKQAEVMGSNSTVPSAQKSQSGSAFKQHNGLLFIPFPDPSLFNSPPIVLTTPFWPSGNIPLSAETVVNVLPNGFLVFSNNSSDNINGAPYFVNWFAIGT
jgi:hypothetical protein